MKRPVSVRTELLRIITSMDSPKCARVGEVQAALKRLLRALCRTTN